MRAAASASLVYASANPPPSLVLLSPSPSPSSVILPRGNFCTANDF
ncbi:unnamed protein product [Rhodiola kirilowii]